MSTYIKIENGQTKDHPLMLDNLKALHGSDFEDRYEELGYLPCTPGPAAGTGEPYAKVVPIYTIEGNVVTTNYMVTFMTQEERLDKIARYKEMLPKPYESWIFDENICNWVAPISYPEDGNLYQWDEETTNWVLISE